MRDKGRFVRSLAALAATAVVGGLGDRAFGAFTYPISGTSYTANLMNHRNSAGVNQTTVTATYAGGSFDQSGGTSPPNIADGGFTSWTIANITGLPGNQPGDATATATATLSQMYNINLIKIYTQDYVNEEFEIRVSDGITTTVVAPRQANPGPESVVPIAFTARNVNQIQWQVWGPGTNSGPLQYAYAMDLQAFASATTVAPDIREGYNILPTATSVTGSGFFGFANYTNTVDGDPRSYAIPEAAQGPGNILVDFGQLDKLYEVRLDFAYGQNWTSAKIEISADAGFTSPYTVFTSAGSFSNSNFVFAPQFARYLRITNITGSGALAELQVFAIPEPASATTLIGLGALALTKRRRTAR